MVREIRHLVTLAAIAVMTTACPDYPDNEDHQGAENPDCRACHVHDDVGPSLPENHFEGEELDWTNCKHCHRQE